MKLLTYILTFALLLIALALATENQQLVDVNLLFIKFQTPLNILLYITLLIGAGMTILWTMLRKLTSKSNA